MRRLSESLTPGRGLLPFRLRGGIRRDLLARADVVTVHAGIGRDRILSSFDVLVDRFARLAGESSVTLGCEHSAVAVSSRIKRVWCGGRLPMTNTRDNHEARRGGARRERGTSSA